MTRPPGAVGPGVAGDTDYAETGVGYSVRRRSDPRIAAVVRRALGSAQTVLNVGAGAGSYEPQDRSVLAVEPAGEMRRQRPAHLAPAINAVAAALPFADHSVEASMAILSVHQWPDPGAGIRELLRVTRGPIVLLTFDPSALHRLWLMAYAPELEAIEGSRYPAMDTIVGLLGPGTEVHEVPIPTDCVDGFTEAFFARPEAFLDRSVRLAQSAWSFLDAGVEDRIVDSLAADLRSGAWDRRYGSHREQTVFHGAVRLVVRSSPGATST
jgi:SAM-dependent methyltransferase